MIFASRSEAGKQLSQKLASYKSPHTIVLGIPRGGVVVAAEVARELGVSLDVLTVKKLTAPASPELAIGALAPDNVSYVEWRFAQTVGADEAYVNQELESTADELKRQERLFRKGKKALKLAHQTVILVDDGIATGSTVEAAVKWARKKKAHRVIVAIPVAAAETVQRIKPEVDELIVLEQPEQFRSVGEFYTDFEQVSDEQVVALLADTK